MDDDRVPLSVADAVSMLPDGERIHTFRSGGRVLVGADWPRAELVAAIEEHGAELSGEMATAMQHGICLFDHVGWLFIETRMPTPAQEQEAPDAR